MHSDKAIIYVAKSSTYVWYLQYKLFFFSGVTNKFKMKQIMDFIK